MPLQVTARLYLWLVILAGSVSFAYQGARLDFGFFTLPLLVFSLLTFLAELYEIEIIPRWGLSTAIASNLAALYIGGAPLGVWVVLLATIPAEVILRWEKIAQSVGDFLYHVFFNASQLVLSIVAAAFVFRWAGGHAPPYTSFADYLPLLLAFLVYEVVNASLVSIIISLTAQRPLGYTLKFSLRHLHIHFLSLGVLAILIAVVYAISPWNMVLVLVPLLLVHFSVRSYMRLRRDSRRAFEQITTLLARRDLYTGVHSEEVTHLAERIARALGLSEDEVETIRNAAAIHDIGKIAVPDAMLNKPGPLDEEEWAVIKQHPVIGAELIKDLEIYRDAAPIVRHEHEHWDGTGYPDGLKGEQIPLGARIVAAADVYSALTTERPYRPPQGRPLKYSHEEACRLLREMSGSHLDPKVVDALLQALGED